MQPTEGVPIERVRLPFTKRSLPSNDLDSDLGTADFPDFLPLKSDEELSCKISNISYHIFFEPNTTDTWVHSDRFVVKPDEPDEKAVRGNRSKIFKERFEQRKLPTLSQPASEAGNVTPTFALSATDVDDETKAFDAWIKDGVISKAESRERSQEDHVMTE
jgi:hypothetical protein